MDHFAPALRRNVCPPVETSRHFETPPWHPHCSSVLIMSRALRILVPALALGAALVCSPATASAEWVAPVNYAKSPWGNGANAQAMALQKPDVTRTGREGSTGWGPFRRFKNTPVASTLSSGDLQQTATSTSKGWAFVGAKRKADGLYRAFGFGLKTNWKSETTGGGTTIIQTGRTSLVGSTPESNWSAHTAGAKPTFARGHEFVDRHQAQGYWTVPRKGSPEYPRTAGTYTRNGAQPATIETASTPRAPARPMNVAQLRLADQHR